MPKISLAMQISLAIVCVAHWMRKERNVEKNELYNIM